MSDPTPTSSAAHLLSTQAHAVRNHIATLRSVGHLIEEPDIAGELDTATSAIQLLLERAVTVARVELGERPAPVRITAQELLRHAERRAAREGHRAEPRVGGVDATDERQINVPGTWAERLLADLIHVAADAPVARQAVDDASVEIRCTIEQGDWKPLGGYLRMLASECGGVLERHGASAVLRLPAG